MNVWRIIGLALMVCVSAHPGGSCFADRTLVHEGVINAPVKQVWEAFTTVEGMKAIMIPVSDVDLRVGGAIRTSYNPAATLGDESTIINRILAFEPERMLSMQNVQAPKGFPHAELFGQTWTVMYFEPLAPDRTHLRVVGMGYGEGPEWDVIYNFFKAGNAQVIESLRKRFDPQGDAEDPARVMEVMGRFVGGEWIHENTRADGKVFRVRNRCEWGADGKSIVSSGWLGGGDGMTAHASCIIWRSPEPEGGEVRFLNISENSAVARGAIRLAGPESVEWDWNATALDGQASQLRVEMTFEDERHYNMRILRLPAGGEPSLMVEARFERVDETPERFVKMREAKP
jgi:uncharacterized protein YndB with AHSA1/START domain